MKIVYKKQQKPDYDAGAQTFWPKKLRDLLFSVRHIEPQSLPLNPPNNNLPR